MIIRCGADDYRLKRVSTTDYRLRECYCGYVLITFNTPISLHSTMSSWGVTLINPVVQLAPWPGEALTWGGVNYTVASFQPPSGGAIVPAYYITVAKRTCNPFTYWMVDVRTLTGSGSQYQYGGVYGFDLVVSGQANYTLANRLLPTCSSCSKTTFDLDKYSSTFCAAKSWWDYYGALWPSVTITVPT